MEENYNKEIKDELERINQWQIDHKEDDEKAFKKMDEKHESDHQEIKAMLEKMNQKLDPVADFYDNMDFSKKLVMWVLGFIGASIGVVIGVIQIIKMLK